MSTYIVEALVTGKVYYEIEAECEKNAIKTAYKENANKKCIQKMEQKSNYQYVMILIHLLLLIRNESK